MLPSGSESQDVSHYHQRTWYSIANYRSHRYEYLRRELLQNPTADPQSLPYLSSVIKEGLRIALANPTRLPRVVGSTGLTVDSKSIPPGSIVGVSAYSLLLNGSVFPNPHNFEPERWLDPSPEMIRDSMMFGVGDRQCIGRNLATAELFWAVDAIVRKDVLRGARTVKAGIEIVEWFNSKVKGEKVELVWDG
jgi:cytochrome P450